jgi:hypothetical protein
VKPDNSKAIDEIVRILSKPSSAKSHAEQLLQDAVLKSYNAIRNKPLQPYAEEEVQHLAHLICVVMNYLDKLIAWADNLFQQDTVESINEAAQLYVLAANILGTPNSETGETLLGYRDTIADRLFKIRDCMNIAGVVRPLASFNPPVEPRLLVKAAEAKLASARLADVQPDIRLLRTQEMLSKGRRFNRKRSSSSSRAKWARRKPSKKKTKTQHRSAKSHTKSKRQTSK